MSKISSVILFSVFSIFSESFYLEKMYSTKINTDIVVADLIYKESVYINKNKLYLTFKRGDGSSSLDNQICLCYSYDNGNTWKMRTIEPSPLLSQIGTRLSIESNDSTIVIFGVGKSVDLKNVAFIATSKNPDSPFSFSIVDDPLAYTYIFSYQSDNIHRSLLDCNNNLLISSSTSTYLYVKSLSNNTSQLISFPFQSSYTYNYKNNLFESNTNIFLFIESAENNKTYIHRSTKEKINFALIDSFSSIDQNGYSYETKTDSISILWIEKSLNNFTYNNELIIDGLHKKSIFKGPALNIGPPSLFEKFYTIKFGSIVFMGNGVFLKPTDSDSFIVVPWTNSTGRNSGVRWFHQSDSTFALFYSSLDREGYYYERMVMKRNPQGISIRSNNVAPSISSIKNNSKHLLNGQYIKTRNNMQLYLENSKKNLPTN